jgi:hypothetical protein
LSKWLFSVVAAVAVVELAETPLHRGDPELAAVVWLVPKRFF